MVDQSDSKANAIEQLRELSELAQRGRASVVNTGSIMLIWGVAVTTASLAERLFEGSTYTVAAWIVPVLLAFLASLLAMRLSRSDGRAVTWRSRAVYRIWVAAGAAIVIFNVGEELRRGGLQSESEAATALILSIAVLSTAEVAGRKVLSFIGMGWMAVALTLLWANVNSLLVILALGAAVLQIVPGLFLLCEEWKK